MSPWWRVRSSSRACEAIPGGHAVSRLAFRQTKYPCGIAAVAGAKVRHRDTLKGTGPAKRSPCWHSGRLPRSLAQKFVIASLRSDLPVDLAGDWFSSRDSGRLPRSLALPRNDGILSLRSDTRRARCLPVGIQADKVPLWYCRGRWRSLAMTGFSSSRNDTRRARCLPGGGCVRHRELAKRSPC